MAEPPAFAAHFRQLVLPRLHNLLRAEAACIAAGVETWAGGYDAVLRYAISRGALHLPDELLADLEDWIACQLLELVSAP